MRDVAHKGNTSLPSLVNARRDPKTYQGGGAGRGLPGPWPDVPSCSANDDTECNLANHSNLNFNQQNVERHISLCRCVAEAAFCQQAAAARPWAAALPAATGHGARRRPFLLPI